MDLTKNTRKNNRLSVKKTSIFLISFLIFLASCVDKIKKEIVETYPDGTTKLERFYKNKKDSMESFKEIHYYQDKKHSMEGELIKGKRHGKWTSWYPNGNKWSEGYFKNGISDSIRTTYYENGNKRYEGCYKVGKQIGIWKFWLEDGKLAEEKNYSKN